MRESDRIYLDLEEPPAPGWLDEDKRKKTKTLPGDEGYEEVAPKILKLPEREKPLRPSEVAHGVTQRAKACANMRLDGASFMEIAEVLEYRDAAEAKRDFQRALAATHPPEDWETMRHMESARAEKLFKQSIAMASADYLLDEEGNKVANTEKLKWHQQAAADLMNHAVISGAKAPTKMEITPGEAQLEQIVEQLIARSGHEVVHEAEVLELTQIPALESGEGGDDLDEYAE